MLQVLSQEIIHRPDGIFIRRGIEVKSTAQKVPYRISNKKLVSGGSVALQGEINAIDAIWCCKGLRLDGRSLVGVLLVGKGESIIDQGVKVIFAYLFVADVNSAVELRKIDVDPVRIFRSLFKKGGILYNLCIGRVFKTIRIAWLVKRLVCFLWKVYFKISPRLICIIAVAGK